MALQNYEANPSPGFIASSLLIQEVVKRDGRVVRFDEEALCSNLQRACKGLELDVSVEVIMREVGRNIFDGITTIDLEKACILAASTFIERDPAYGRVATRLLLQKLLREIRGYSVEEREYDSAYRSAFVKGIYTGIEHDIFDKRLAEIYDLELLASCLKIERDELLTYTSLYTLYERYFSKHNGIRFEAPQAFWMRIAMGLALKEENAHDRALEFYELISTLRYVPSTPTLFHAGFPVAQLSSCYLNMVGDDLAHIFKCLGDNAQLAKWAGGIGTSWTKIRATGSWIKSIKATSQGVIPYLKLANDVVVAITRSGIRRGGTCVYLETWHLDIEDFLDLRRNTGDERRRTHDMNTSNWIPDLFMKRVLEDKEWTLFSPEEVPDLADLYGKEFEARYQYYERLALEGGIRQYRQMPAKNLWRKMLTRLFETGHPWITFKDACNIRSPQDHVGRIYNSNLCTEITLNTSPEETAVCNLGSVNLERHVTQGKLDEKLLSQTISSAIRMLDNVIDLNFYPTVEAKTSNQRHRPVGLGLMGFQDALFKLDIHFASEQAREFADYCMEKFSYFAIEASCQLAQQRGAYSSFKGSKWDRSIFPLDTLDLLAKERGVPIEVSRTSTLDWAALKEKVKLYGMRNSNVMAIAPNATISTIAGCFPCIEPVYKNIYVKANVTGEFTVINTYLVEDLKKLGLWSQAMLDQLKYYDGDLAAIPAIPQALKDKYKTAFELDSEWLIQLTAVRSKWIDQSQSHNVFLQGASGQKLHDIYFAAWRYGLKTTYYLRTLGATQIEKSTLDAKTFGFTQKRVYEPVKGAQCSMDTTDCESCQ